MKTKLQGLQEGNAYLSILSIIEFNQNFVHIFFS